MRQRKSEKPSWPLPVPKRRSACALLITPDHADEKPKPSMVCEFAVTLMVHVPACESNGAATATASIAMAATLRLRIAGRVEFSEWSVRGGFVVVVIGLRFYWLVGFSAPAAKEAS